jgi:uncharacterized protein
VRVCSEPLLPSGEGALRRRADTGLPSLRTYRDRNRSRDCSPLQRVCTALVLYIALTVAAFAYTLPALTGSVVDQANVIPDATRTALGIKLEKLEQDSGIQFVVATVSSLEGDAIEPYANALFRAWKLGEKTKNNGVLLLVAPKEHRVRIEVGYGLEGTLTDALSKVIITNAIAPRFKAGDFAGGITRGVDDTITVLTTDSSDWQKKPGLRTDTGDAPVDPIVVFVVLAIFLIVFIIIIRSAHRSTVFWGTPGSGGGFTSGHTWSSGSGGGFSGGGDFSGGGGSSGGGGASGDW